MTRLGSYERNCYSTQTLLPCSDTCTNKRVSKIPQISCTTLINFHFNYMTIGDAISRQPPSTNPKQKKNNSSPRALPIVTPYFTEIWAAHYPLLTSPIPKSCSTMQTREIAYVWLPWLRIPMLLNPNAPHIYIVTSATSSKSQKARNLFHHKFDDIHFSYMTIDDAVSKQNSEYSKQKQDLTIYIPDRHTMLHRTKSCSSSFPPLFYLPHYSHSQLL